VAERLETPSPPDGVHVGTSCILHNSARALSSLKYDGIFSCFVSFFDSKFSRSPVSSQGLVKVAALDADQYKDVATKVGIRGFPTLKIYSPEKTYNPYTKKSTKIPTDYNGPRTAKAMAENVLAQLPNYVQSVKSEGLNTFLADDYPKALLFTDKDDVPSLLKAVALKYNGKLRIGHANSIDKDLAAKFGLTEFPKLVAIPGTDTSAAVKHDGKIKLAEIDEFLSKYALTAKKEDPIRASKKPLLIKTLTAEGFAEDVEKDKTNMWLVYFHKGGKIPQVMMTCYVCVS
jgi:protein disulfide-isomerase A6